MCALVCSFGFFLLYFTYAVNFIRKLSGYYPDNGPDYPLSGYKKFPDKLTPLLWIEAGHMRTDDPFFNRKPTITFSENDDPEDKYEKAYLDGSTLF